MGAQILGLLPNVHPNPSQGRQKGFGRSQLLKNFLVLLNSLHNSNFGAFGGPMAQANGPSGHYVGPYGGDPVPVLSPNDYPNPSQGRQKGFGKSPSLKNFQVLLNSLSKSNFGAFGGPMAGATWAQRPLRGSPWALKYPYCQEMITQTHPRADRQVSEKLEFLKKFSDANKQPNQCENGLFLTSKGPYGGEGGPGGTRMCNKHITQNSNSNLAH